MPQIFVSRPLRAALAFALVIAAAGAYALVGPAAGAAVPAGNVTVAGQSRAVAGINVYRPHDGLVIYTRTGTRHTSPANQWGYEAAVVGGRVVAVSDYRPGMVIPSGGVVLSGHGASRTWLRTHARVGAAVMLPASMRTVAVAGATSPVAGVDVYRAQDSLVVYTRAAGRTASPANAWGFEAAVVGGRVTAVRDYAAGMPIPSGGVVLSGHGTARTWLLTHAKLGAAVVLPADLPLPATAPSTGTPAPTVSPSSTASPPPAVNRVLPAKFTGGYIEWWYNQRIQDLPPDYNLLWASFATIDSSGRATYTHGNGQSKADFAAGIAARRAAGKPVILSIGGAGGTQAPLTPGPQVENFLASVRPILDSYGFSGIDWDLEADLPGGQQISAAGLVEASKRLRAHYGPSFLLTMAPYGDTYGTDALYVEVAKQIQPILSFVAYQLYSTSYETTGASTQAILERWIRATGIRPDQFTLGFMPLKAYNGIPMPPEKIAEVYRHVTRTYPTMRGVWIWGVYEFDKPDGWAFAKRVSPVVGSPV